MIWLIGYALAAVICTAIFAALLRHDLGEPLDTEDYVLSYGMGALLGLMWPVVLILGALGGAAWWLTRWVKTKATDRVEP